jgi:hypothetical protein
VKFHANRHMNNFLLFAAVVGQEYFALSGLAIRPYPFPRAVVVVCFRLTSIDRANDETLSLRNCPRHLAVVGATAVAPKVPPYTTANMKSRSVTVAADKDDNLELTDDVDRFPSLHVED